MMIHLDRVAREIKHVGFYDMLLQDIKEYLKNENPSVETIKKTLQEKPSFLEAYKQLNVEYNLSNIHTKPIDIEKIDKKCIEKAKRVNENLQKLKVLEKYTLDFEKSSFLVILFSIEFFVLFSVQYFIVLLSLKEYQILIYTLFALSIVVAWYMAKREKRKYVEGKKAFETLYQETKNLLDDLENKGCIRKEDLLEEKSEDHI